MNDVVFDDADTQGRNKTQAITEFIGYAHDELAKEGLFVSADVFGNHYAQRRGYGCRGPEYEDMAEQLDYICPMIYPSHYGPGNFGIEYPDTQPYDTILNALNGSRSFWPHPQGGCAAGVWQGRGFRTLLRPIWNIILNMAMNR